jgi:UDP-glucose 4-epimerase
VINQCVQYKTKLVFTSSVAVYSGQAPFHEGTVPSPIDEYGLSKYMSELSIKIAGDQQGLDWCIVRPRNVYGERQSLWDSARNVFGIWMNQIRYDKPLTIYGDGLQTRAFTYIGDILEPLYKAAFVRGEIINLGSSLPIKVFDASRALASITKHYTKVHLPARHEVAEAWCLTEKSKMILGYKDKTHLHEGLKKMWNWANRQPHREQTALPELEIVI